MNRKGLISTRDRRKFRSISENAITAKHIHSGRELVIQSSADHEFYKLTLQGTISVNDKVRLTKTSHSPSAAESEPNPLYMYLEGRSAEFWGREGLMFAVYFDSYLLQRIAP
jgi:hypothetical protein